MTLHIFIVKTANFVQFKCFLVLLIIILWLADSFYIVLVPNYVQKHTKMDKKLKSCFDFTEGVPATLQGKEEGGGVHPQRLCKT